MDGFKLKSIEEFDLNFVNNSRVESKPAASQENLIPEINFNAEGNTGVDETPASGTYFTDVDTDKKVKTPRPLTPIGQKPSPYAPTEKEETYSPEIILDENNFEEEPVRKSGKGLLVGKIISIVMLCVTVVVFLLGCFTATFLDTFQIGKFNISTQCADVENLKLSQGDLLISKVLDPSEYAYNSVIVKPEKYYDGIEEKNLATVAVISSVSSYGDSAAIEIINPINGSVDTITSEECKGEVLFYIPVLAGILNFALQADNAILVCALFVLLAAFWCLLLVLLSKASKKNKETEVDLINE